MDAVCQEFAAAFAENFGFLQGKNLVLYGLGYRTGGLIEALGDKFHFIGLMDRDEENIGKIFFGKSVLDRAAVIERADAIVIVSVSFYDVIFRRIATLWTEHHIPIYFPNGVQATMAGQGYDKMPEEAMRLAREQVKADIQAHDVISFDLFDTLLMRKVLDSETVFSLVEALAGQPGFYKARKEAYNDAQKERTPTWEDIYARVILALADSGAEKGTLQAWEKRVEERLLSPRQAMVDCFSYAKTLGKSVYIVSDMYFPREVLAALLSSFGIALTKERILVSADEQCSKEGGTLFDVLKERENGAKRFLHIGDDLYSDVYGAEKKGITARRIYSAKEMMRHTIFYPFLAEEESLIGKTALGLIGQKLFNSPFPRDRVDDTGKVIVRDERELGYIAYGPLIFSYLGYLFRMCREKKIKKLLFCARDGFLLKEAFDRYGALLGADDIETKYLKISRLLIRKMMLQSSEAIHDFANLPYRGTKKEFFWQRFGCEVEAAGALELPRDFSLIEGELAAREDEISAWSRAMAERYESYLRQEIGSFAGAALVDFGYTGSTQYYLSQFLQRPLTGFYLLANMADDNPYNDGQRKYSCIFNERDRRGQKSSLQKLFLLLEAVYTAPYGTFTAMEEGGDFVTAPVTKNNIYFSVKEKIHEGVIDFMRDMVAVWGEEVFRRSLSPALGAKLLDAVFGEHILIPQGILDTFYQDDILRHQTDRKIFS